jgi:hypothetical protein
VELGRGWSGGRAERRWPRSGCRCPAGRQSSRARAGRWAVGVGDRGHGRGSVGGPALVVGGNGGEQVTTRRKVRMLILCTVLGREGNKTATMNF